MKAMKLDLDTARMMLKKEMRRRKIRRGMALVMLVVALSVLAVYLLLQTSLFADVYMQLTSDLGLV